MWVSVMRPDPGLNSTWGRGRFGVGLGWAQRERATACGVWARTGDAVPDDSSYSGGDLLEMSGVQRGERRGCAPPARVQGSLVYINGHVMREGEQRARSVGDSLTPMPLPLRPATLQPPIRIAFPRSKRADKGQKAIATGVNYFSNMV